jgi:hypothetical protein
MKLLALKRTLPRLKPLTLSLFFAEKGRERSRLFCLGGECPSSPSPRVLLGVKYSIQCG